MGVVDGGDGGQHVMEVRVMGKVWGKVRLGDETKLNSFGVKRR